MEKSAREVFRLPGSRARAVYGPSKKRMSQEGQFPYSKSNLLLPVKNEIETTSDTAGSRNYCDPEPELLIPVTFAGTLEDQKITEAKHFAYSRRSHNGNHKRNHPGRGSHEKLPIHSRKEQCKGPAFESRLCSLMCPEMWGCVPSIECTNCLCLFHPVCSGVPDDTEPELLAIFECEACSR